MQKESRLGRSENCFHNVCFVFQYLFKKRANLPFPSNIPMILVEIGTPCTNANDISSFHHHHTKTEDIFFFFPYPYIYFFTYRFPVTNPRFVLFSPSFLHVSNEKILFYNINRKINHITYNCTIKHRHILTACKISYHQ